MKLTDLRWGSGVTVGQQTGDWEGKLSIEWERARILWNPWGQTLTYEDKWEPMTNWFSSCLSLPVNWMVICRGSWHSWPKTWRDWKKRYCGSQSEGGAQWSLISVKRASRTGTGYRSYSCASSLPTNSEQDCYFTSPSPPCTNFYVANLKSQWEGNSGNHISSSAELIHKKPPQMYTQFHSAFRIWCDIVYPSSLHQA